MFSVLFLKAYRKPRELTWVSGMILLFLVMGFGFSGYLLPWNTLAFFATKVGTEIAGQVPVVGKPLMIFLRGGEEVTGATLTRFFGFHVAVLPGITTLLIAAASVAGSAAWDERAAQVEAAMDGGSRRDARNALLPQLLLRELMAWYIALGVLGALAAFPWDWEQGRSLCLGSRRNQAGMVLPVHVPDAEADSGEDRIHRRRIAGHSGIRPGGVSGFASLSGSNGKGRSQRGLRARVLLCWRTWQP